MGMHIDQEIWGKQNGLAVITDDISKQLELDGKEAWDEVCMLERLSSVEKALTTNQKQKLSIPSTDLPEEFESKYQQTVAALNNI